MKWWEVVGGLLQIIYLFLKNKYEKDAEKKAEKDALLQEANDAIKSGDAGALNVAICAIRRV